MRVLTTNEAVEIYGIPAERFAAWCEEGNFRTREIVPYQDDHGLWQIYDLAIEDFLNRNPDLRVRQADYTPSPIAKPPALITRIRNTVLPPFLWALTIFLVGLVPITTDLLGWTSFLPFPYKEHLLPPRVVAAPDEQLILVAAFMSTTGDASADAEIALTIKSELTSLQEDQIHIVFDSSGVAVANHLEAQELGEREDADIVIWGKESKGEVAVNYLLLNPEPLSPPAEQEVVAKNFEGLLPFFSHYAIAQAYYAQHRLAPAIATFEQTVASFRDDVVAQPRAYTYFYLGNLYQAPGEGQELAIDYYTKAIALDPRFANAYMRRGDFLMRHGELDRALQDFNNALEIAPENATFYNARGTLYVYMEKSKETLQDFTHAIELEPDNANAYANRCWYYGSHGQFNEALADCNRAIALQPSATAYYSLGRVEYGEGKFDEAMKNLDQAVKLEPYSLDSYLFRAFLYSTQDDTVSAIDDYTRAIEIDPGSTVAYSQRCIQSMNMRLWKRALDDCNQAVSLAPDSADMYLKRCYYYLMRDWYDEALQDCNQAIELDPNYPAAYDNRGYIYSHQGKYQEALNEFEYALKLNPDFEDAQQGRDEMYEKMGQ